MLPAFIYLMHHVTPRTLAANPFHSLFSRSTSIYVSTVSAVFNLTTETGRWVRIHPNTFHCGISMRVSTHGIGYESRLHCSWNLRGRQSIQMSTLEQTCMGAHVQLLDKTMIGCPKILGKHRSQANSCTCANRPSPTPIIISPTSNRF